MNKNNAIIIFAILLVVIFGWYITQTRENIEQSPNNNEITYTEDGWVVYKYSDESFISFSFEYPPEWQISGDGIRSGGVGVGGKHRKVSGPNNIPIVSFYVFGDFGLKRSADELLEERKDSIILDPNPNTAPKLYQTDFQLDTISGKVLKITPVLSTPYKDQTIRYFFEKDGIGFEVLIVLKSTETEAIQNQTIANIERLIESIEVINAPTYEVK